MATKSGGKPRRGPSLSDANKLYSEILAQLRDNPTHPRWALLVRAVAALQELNEVLCLLASPDGDCDFGCIGLPRR